MRNPKTTIAGYLLMAASLATVAAHLLSGTFGASDITALTGVLAGFGLIAASDGGH